MACSRIAVAMSSVTDIVAIGIIGWASCRAVDVDASTRSATDAIAPSGDQSRSAIAADGRVVDHEHAGARRRAAGAARERRQVGPDAPRRRRSTSWRGDACDVALELPGDLRDGAALSSAAPRAVDARRARSSMRRRGVGSSRPTPPARPGPGCLRRRAAPAHGLRRPRGRSRRCRAASAPRGAARRSSRRRRRRSSRPCPAGSGRRTAGPGCRTGRRPGTLLNHCGVWTKATFGSLEVAEHAVEDLRARGPGRRRGSA